MSFFLAAASAAQSSLSMASATVVLALMLAWAAVAESSSLSSYWHHELPNTEMPEAFEKLASPLSSSDTHGFLSQIKAGSLQVSANQDFCSSAGVYCSQKAVVPVRTPQPRVCIPPFFFYAYAVLPCNRNNGGSAASAVQASSQIFVSQSSLVRGQTVQLPDTTNDLKGLKFLPSSFTEVFPKLDSANLPEMLKFYGVDKSSDMELEMENTLAHCSYKSEHEVKACTTSGEGVVNFVTQTIGHDAVVYAPSPTAKELATIVDITMVSSEGDKVAACHDMKFPSLLYSCHMTQTAQLMEVSLKLANGDMSHMPIVCHMDTSYWNPSHVAFQALNVQPGKSSICHWFPENSFIFVQGTHE